MSGINCTKNLARNIYQTWPKLTKRLKECIKFIQGSGFSSKFIKKQEKIFIKTNEFNLKYGNISKYNLPK